MRDDAAHERAALVNHLEVRRRAQIHHDEGRRIGRAGGNEVGYPVGSQLAGVVVAHLHARLHAGSHHEGASAGKRARRGHPCIREPRHHRRDDGIVADRTTAVALQHVEQPRHPHARLVGRHALRRGHLPGGFQLAADEEAQVRIRVPHVHA